MKHSLWIAVGLMLMESALVAAPINYSENFDSWATTGIPTSASGVADYWYFVGDPNAYYSGASMTGGVTWAGGGPGGSPWLYAGNSNGHFHGVAYRDFRTAGTLAANESVVGAVVSAYTQNGSGSNEDAALFSGLWLVDDSGNGYVGHVARNGDMSLYKSVGWALTGIGTGASGVGGNAKNYSLSVAGGNVTLNFNYYGNATVYTTSVADASYSAFTTIGLEGAYFSNEELGFDNVGLTGAVIPEPATAGLLAVAGALVLMRRRKQG